MTMTNNPQSDRFLRQRELVPAEQLSKTPCTVIGVGAIGFTISITSQELVFALVSYAWAGLGSSFGPTLLMTLWWKKTTGTGVLAGMAAGTITTILWAGFPELDSFLSSRLIAWIAALSAVLIISQLTYKKDSINR